MSLSPHQATNLANLRKVISKVEPTTYNHGVFRRVNECGTTMCALGHAIDHNEEMKFGLNVEWEHPDEFGRSYLHVLTNDETDIEQEADRVFGGGAYEWIFSDFSLSYECQPEDVQPEDVCQAIDAFAAGHHYVRRND